MKTINDYLKYRNIIKTNPLNIDIVDDIYVIKYDIHGHDAFTLNERDIGNHEDGWSIFGKIHSDYFTWVNAFHAIKDSDNNQRVWGDFEKVVYATSLEVLDDFLENHSPDKWDYWDI